MPRFLCPHCLRFGEALFACPGCWEATSVLRTRLNVGSLHACPCCYDALYPTAEVDRLAYCEHCRQVSDAQLHHHRVVRLVGVLGPAAFANARQHLGENANGAGSLRLAHEQQVTYLLEVSSAAPEMNVVGPTHALRHLDALWLTGTGIEALELGRNVDRFVRQARLSGTQRRSLPVLLRETSLPAPALNVLRSRLSSLRFGIDLPEVLSSEQGWPVESLGGHQELPWIVATTDERSFRTLADLLPATRTRHFHPGIAGAEVKGRLTILVDAGRLSHSRQERAAPVRQAANALWIDRLPEAKLLPGFLERLCRQFGQSRTARERVCLLGQAESVDEDQMTRLAASFPNVSWGVTPTEALIARQNADQGSRS